MSAEAQSAPPPPITTSGLNTQVSAPVVTGSGSTQTTQYNITGGTRPGGGVNLYHSFGDFNVPTNNIANFLNSGSIGLNGAVLPPNLPTANILGRINGGNPSSIFGMIQTNGPGGFPNANLFLMNPNGFLFGPAATINVGGMVTFTTADYMRLTDNTRFNAVAGPTDLLLTAAPVAAFGFLGNNPAAIAIQGSTLQVADGKALSLVGGNQGFTATDPDTGNPIPVLGGITMTGGKLAAPGGQINIASVAGPGEVSAVDFMPTPGMAMGNISLSQGALLDVSSDAGGTIQIRGGQLVISDSTLAANTINSNGASVAVDIQVSGDLSLIDTTGVTSISAQTSGAGNAGAVNISSANLTASTSNSGFPGVVMIDTHTSGSGKGGDVNITTGNLDASSSVLENSISIFVDTGFTANGHGGNVSIAASRFNMFLQTITAGDFRLIFSSTPELFVGSAGNISIAADDLQIRAGQVIADAGNAGTGGNLNLQAKNMLLDNSNITAFGFQRGGFLNLKADTLTTSNTLIESAAFNGPGAINIVGNAIDFTKASTVVSSTGGDGDAAPINITAHDHLSLSGFIQDFVPELGFIGRPTGIFSNSFGVSGTHGNAGTITINTPSLVMTDGARINTTTAANGRGGDVIINAQSVSMSGEFTSFIPEPLFNLGTIHAGGISTTTVGGSCVGPCGNAGNISITTNTLNVTNGAQINSGTISDGNGGLITINARDTISISGKLSDGSPGGILSQAVGTTPGSGSGGNISLISGQSISISDGATVSASTTGPGNAGNILVKAKDVAITGGGTITAASTGAGNAGTVTIQGLNSPADSFLVDGAASGVFTTTEDAGAGGNISIDVNTVMLQNGGTLSATTSGTAPSASGGTITVNAGQVALNNQALITADTNGVAPAGTIDINTNGLAINSGGQIRSSSGAEQALVAALAAAPTLTGGTITVEGQGGAGSQAGSVTIDGAGSGIFTQSTGNRPGGDINILTSGSVTMTNGASISASSTGAGNAGNIQINAGNQFAMTNSSVTTEATQSGGGLIKITTTPNGIVELTNSKVSASVLDGNGGGGSVNIDPQFVVLQNSQILAQAVQGPGGNISITTNLLLPDSTSIISASSQFGQQGTISIQSPIAPAGGKVFPLPQKPLIGTSLVNQRCAALAGGSFSSFTVAGRDSLPAEPGGWLSSPLALATAEAGDTVKEASSRTSESETMEAPPLLSLRHIAPPGFLTQSFAVDSSDCTS